MQHPTDGILLIDKDEGESSYEVVRKVRRLLNIRKVGHAGTLDPFATGLLIILLGQGTKLSNPVMSENKLYLATLRLGVETDTLDFTGRVVRTCPVPDLVLEYIQEKADTFVGDFEQTPPMYSAVKYKGTPAYKLARKGLEVALKKKIVTIYFLRVLSVNLPDIIMEVNCSSGTYIRSLAADLGKKLGPGGHLISLRRLASGSFKAKNALSSQEISTKQNRFSLRKKVIPLRESLPGVCEIEVEGSIAKKVRHGYQPSWEELTKGLDLAGWEDGYAKLVKDSELVAIVTVNRSKYVDRAKVRIERVFS